MKLSENLEERILFSTLKNKNNNNHIYQQAFIKAYDLYVDQIYRFIYFKVGSKEEAEDLSSLVFLKTWGHIRTNGLTTYTSLKPLLYKISRNIIIDHYRKTNREKSLIINNLENLDIIDDKQDIIKKTDSKIDLLVIETKLPQLKDEYREIIILRFINDLSIKEIAEILNKSKGNIRVLIYRALNALKILVENN